MRTSRPIAFSPSVPAPLDGSATGPDTLRPRRLRSRAVLGDRLFRGYLRVGGALVLGLMAAVGLFLGIKAWPALRAAGWQFLTRAEWQPDVHHFGIAAVLTGTVLIALVAVVISVPVALATALFISEVARPGVRRTLITLVDLMAAIPSVVYGLWGFFLLQGQMVGLARWLSTWLGWIPIFAVDGSDPRSPLATLSVYTSSAFIAGVVVSLMVMPIQCAVMREAFEQAPIGEREAAFALGSTRWGMIRTVVLPFGRGGIIGGTMLGLGRALGETVAVYLIISAAFTVNIHILQAGTSTVSSLIALRFGDASGFGLAALMAAGLALFALTLIVNFVASGIASRSRSGLVSQ